MNRTMPVVTSFERCDHDDPTIGARSKLFRVMSVSVRLEQVLCGRTVHAVAVAGRQGRAKGARRLHGAELTVDSELERGSKFTMRLPLKT
jgi:hypothetical protein